VEGDTTSLEIDEAFVEDSGHYCVVAKNAVGDARTSCDVYVTASSQHRLSTDAGFSPPEFKFVFDDSTLAAGEACTLRATVIGNPLPKV